MENNNAKSYSIAALVCGILGIVGSFIPVVCYFTFVLAILGTVIGALGIICVVCAVGIFSAAGTAGMLS